jgi:hypothetical protein
VRETDNGFCVATSAERLLTALRAFLARFGERVPERFVAGLDAPMPEYRLRANPLACLRHLDRIAAIAPPEARALVGELAGGRNSLCWGQTYSAADFGRDFLDNYGWLELLGTRGHFSNDKIAAGFLILGPRLLYPDHHHTAEEIYIPLTGGTEWRMGDGDFEQREAGAVIHHASDMRHAMRTGDEPLLAVYLWRGGPLAQKSIIDTARGA